MHFNFLIFVSLALFLSHSHVYASPVNPNLASKLSPSTDQVTCDEQLAECLASGQSDQACNSGMSECSSQPTSAVVPESGIGNSDSVVLPASGIGNPDSAIVNSASGIVPVIGTVNSQRGVINSSSGILPASGVVHSDSGVVKRAKSQNDECIEDACVNLRIGTISAKADTDLQGDGCNEDGDCEVVVQETGP